MSLKRLCVHCSINTFLVGARGSALSRAQVQEVLEELRLYRSDIAFQPIWVETKGDKDLATSLRDLDKTNFFTQEIDALQLRGECRISVHSAKDLPDPLASGLELIALTKGVDPSDSLVLRQGFSLQDLPYGAKVGTSSRRREQSIKELRSDLICTDIRGDVCKRLCLLDQGAIDALVVAEAALIRLGLEKRNRILLKGEGAPLQGQLAVVALRGMKR